MRRIVGAFLAATGAIACPCHLPLTLPLLVGVLGGTALGAAVLAHPGLLAALLGGYFAVALLVGLRLLARPAGRGSGGDPPARQGAPADRRLSEYRGGRMDR